MNRRAFLLALAAGTVAASAGTAGAAAHVEARTAATATGIDEIDRLRRTGRPRPTPTSSAPTLGYGAPRAALHPAPGTSASSAGGTGPDDLAASAEPAGSPANAIPTSAPAAAPPRPDPLPVSLGSVPRLITELPGSQPTVAITVDDGTSSAVIKAYLDFCEASGVRLTFFLNGINPGWTDHVTQLRRLVDSGQIQLANHTWSHPDITGLSDAALADQVRRNERFLNDTYGVTGRPFLRPPFGYHNNRTDRICADLGYTSITMWYGSFGDSSLLTEAQLLALAQQWLTAHRVVIGHANHPTVTHLYPQLLDLIRSRGLTTVTLDDAFFGPGGRDRTRLS